MKYINAKKAVYATVVITTLQVTTSFALNIPGLEETPGSSPYTSSAVTNNNVNALKNFNAQLLEKQIEPYLPQGQKRIVSEMVEPIKAQAGGVDPEASGQALEKTLNDAKSLPYHETIIVDAGEYQATSFEVPANVTLTGVDKSNTIISASNMTLNGPSLSNLTLNVPTITDAATNRLSHLSVTGTIALNAGDITLYDVVVNSASGAAISINNVKSFTLDNVNASGSPALDIISASPGFVTNSTLGGSQAVAVTQNAAVLFKDNRIISQAKFFGDYTNSKQHCVNNTDAAGVDFPQPASANSSNLCVPAKLTLTSVISQPINHGFACNQGWVITIKGGYPPYKQATMSCNSDNNSELTKINDNQYGVMVNSDRAATCNVKVTDAKGQSAMANASTPNCS